MKRCKKTEYEKGTENPEKGIEEKRPKLDSPNR
jgi:hypothetical protein